MRKTITADGPDRAGRAHFYHFLVRKIMDKTEVKAEQSLNPERQYQVAIYCRVSTMDQTTLNQRISLVRYADEKDWVFDEFEETESTRKTRPVKQQLLALLREKKLRWHLGVQARSLGPLFP